MNKRILLTALCVTGLLSSNLLAQENGHKKTIVYTGTVKTFEKADPALVIVKTDKGDITAELAPMTFIDENKIMLAPDDAITVKGYEMTKDGKKTFVVTELTTKDGKAIRFRGDDFKPVWTAKTTEMPAGKIMTHKAKVKSFEKADPAFIIIESDKGEITAELAPVAFLEENKLMFAPGDEVTVKGFEITRDGKQVFVVTEVTTKDKNVVRLRTERGPVWTKITTTDKPTETRDITGTVTVVEEMDTPDGRLVRIKSDSGERVIALGPGTYLEKHKYVLKPGEMIAIKGYEVDRSGKRVFLATEVKKGDAIWKFRRADGTVLWE